MPNRKKNQKVKDARSYDKFDLVDQARPTDVIIPIMGPTGVGKSTFINYAADKNVARVGYDLDSAPQTISHYIVPHPEDQNRRIILVDTPGFDDTYISDTEILRRVGVWLARSYNEDMKLAGVVYLHEISQARMFGTPRKNLLMFNKLTGDKAAQHIVLATTKWDDVKDEVGQKRERQLLSSYWRTMVSQGAQTHRFLATRKSAWEIIDIILSSIAPRTRGPSDDHQTVALQIQTEMVDLQKRIPDTEAGITLRNTLQALLKEQKELAERLKYDLDEDPDLQEIYDEALRQIRETLDQIKMLSVPLGARIMAVFFA